MIERSHFNQEVARVFGRIVSVLDEEDPDVVEAERTGDILKVIFADGVQFILNTQSATHQIWLAGSARGWHFDFQADSEKWMCSKSGDELFGTLQDMVEAKLGYKVELL